MNRADWLLLRSRPVELKMSYSAVETLERLQKAFPPGDAFALHFALHFKLFSAATNIGTFNDDRVRLRIIDMQRRNWLRPELCAQVQPLKDGCMLVGEIRYDPNVKAFMVIQFGAFSLLAGGMTWSAWSSAVVTVLVTALVMLSLHGLAAFSQISQIEKLLHEVSKATGA